MKCIRPRVSEAAAIRLFQRRRFGWLRIPARRRPPTSSSRLPFTELVWLPYYLIRIGTQSGGSQGAITLSVEAYSGSFAVFQMHELLVEEELPGQKFPPKLRDQEAEAIGRRELLTTLLRTRGNRRRLEPGPTLGIEVAHYPYWVYYYERRKGLLDFRVLDAVTGERGAAKTKGAFLHAFCSAADTKGDAGSAGVSDAADPDISRRHVPGRPCDPPSP